MYAARTQSTPTSLPNRTHGFQLQRGAAFGIILLAALIAFEIFNYSTTDFALADMLGKTTFAGIRWSTILALAFCGIDFAGIARLFTPERGAQPQTEVWYLFGAWLLAATMNALLTWWGVSMAIRDHAIQSTEVMDPSLLMRVVPVFVAIMVWLIRILIIGSLSYAGERLFMRVERVQSSPVVNGARNTHRQPLTSMARPRPSGREQRIIPAAAPTQSSPAAPHAPAIASMARPAPRSAAPARPEPTYHKLNA